MMKITFVVPMVLPRTYARSSGFYGSCCQATSPNLKISLWAVFTLKQKKTYLSLQPSLKVDV